MQASISQDPTGIAGGIRSLYAYVADCNTHVDPTGTVDGGSDSDVRASRRRGEVNHIPAFAAYDSVRHSAGPAIWMTAVDHSYTISWKNWRSARAHRAVQRAFVDGGQCIEAIKMDVLDIQGKFWKPLRRGHRRDARLLLAPESRNHLEVAALRAQCGL
jgi:hypothetical protein